MNLNNGVVVSGIIFFDLFIKMRTCNLARINLQIHAENRGMCRVNRGKKFGEKSTNSNTIPPNLNKLKQKFTNPNKRVK